MTPETASDQRVPAAPAAAPAWSGHTPPNVPHTACAPWTAGPAGDPLREAEAVRDELRDALARAGITLPSLTVETTSYADEEPRPLLDLGRCNVPTARRIAAALRPGRDGPDLAQPGPGRDDPDLAHPAHAPHPAHPAA